jgi:hypothetical protein
VEETVTGCHGRGGTVSDTGRRVLWVFLVALALFYVLSRPQQAADAVNATVAAIGVAFERIIAFLTALGR